jgi:Ca2+-binding RTX toxin-like protein
VNWFRSTPETYVNQLLPASGTAVDLVQEASFLPRHFDGDANNNVLVGDVSHDELRGFEGDDALDAMAGFDALFGGEGHDSLLGGSDGDYLLGETGDDWLDGGLDSDTYAYSRGDGADVIVDQGGEEDTLVFLGDIVPEDLTITESVDGLHIQIGSPELGDSIVILSEDSYSQPIEYFSFESGYFWSAAEIDAHIIGNRAPRLTTPLGNQVATVGQEFSFTIPANAFFDPNTADSLTLTATREDGGALPSWMQFDSQTGTFSGTTSFGDAAIVTITVSATDPGGLSASGTFSFDLQPLTYLNGTSGYDQLIASSNAPHWLRGFDGDDQLSGLEGNDTLEGGRGNDNLHGDVGSDTFIWNLGDGRDTITGGSGVSPSEIDTLQLGAGITAENVRVTRAGTTLLVHVQENSGSPELAAAVVYNAFGEYGAAILDRIRFADNTIWDRPEILARALIGTAVDDVLVGDPSANTILGNAGDDSLTGHGGDDDFRGGAGNDQLTGDAGFDTFRFARHDGLDEIADSSGINRIVFDAGILPAEVTLYRSVGAGMLAESPGSANIDDLVLVLNGGQQQIRVENYYNTQDPPVVSEIVFGDGTAWSAANIAAGVVSATGTANTFTATTGDDNYVVDHGNDYVSEAAVGGTDLATSTVSYQLPTNVENLTLSGMFALMGVGNVSSNTILGNEFANVLDGRSGTDILIGGAGDDKYIVSTPVHTSWTNGLDTIVEMAGEGYDTIVAQGIYSATLPDNVEALVVIWPTNQHFSNPSIDQRRKFIGNSLNNVIDADDVRSGLGEIVLDGGSGADVLIGPRADIVARFVIDQPGDQIILRSHVGAIVETSFSYTIQEGVARVDLVGSSAISAQGDSRDNTFYGVTNSAANVLTGGLGNDTYVIGANDVYVENAGEGRDTIKIMEGTTDGEFSVSSFANIENLSLGQALGNASLVGDGNDNTLRGNGGANLLTGGAGNDILHDSSDIASELDTGSDTLLGGSGDDTLSAYGHGADILDGGSGDDLLQGRFDTYRFGLGYDFDTVDIALSGSGVVRILSGVTAEDLRAGRDGMTLHIYVGSLDRLSIVNFFGDDPGNWTHTYGMISGVEFDDGSTLGHSDLSSLAQAANGVPTAGSDTVAGTEAADRVELLGGDDVLNAGAGADVIVGGAGNDTLIGGAGGDIYRYSSSFGIDVIQDTETGSAQDAGIDIIEFDSTIARASVTTSRMTGTDDLLIAVGTQGDQITVLNFFAEGANSDQIESVRFADGSVINVAELLELPAIEGTEAAYTPNAMASSSILYGPGGISDGDGTTLGAKAAAEDATYRVWQPIKSFPMDDSSIGMNRLIDAMATFGVDLVSDIAQPASDALDFDKFGVAPSHDLARMSHLRTEWRPTLD